MIINSVKCQNKSNLILFKNSLGKDQQLSQPVPQQKAQDQFVTQTNASDQNKNKRNMLIASLIAGAAALIGIFIAIKSHKKPNTEEEQSTVQTIKKATGEIMQEASQKNKEIAVYAGSFDPITNGHLDLVKTASNIFDKVIVLVAKNPKKTGFIPVEKRVELIKESVKGMDNVEVDAFNGLTVDYAKSKEANFLLRGLRTVSDFDSEMQISEINSKLNPEIKTIFLNSNSECSAISSSAVREILGNNGDIDKFVPTSVAEYLSKYPKGQ